MIAELMAVCRGIPIITIERNMQLGELAAIRQTLAHPPSWVAIFAKAYAIVANHRPELRRAYLGWPWPRFYETEESIGSIAVEREYSGESAVFFGQFRSPNTQPLMQLTEAITTWRETPIHDVSEFARLLRIMRIPGPLRRFLWWYVINWSGRLRTRYVGTFGISSTASSGATCRNLISPVSTAINYGVLNDDGSLDVRLHFDHRVLDGMPAARALQELEDVLVTQILNELRQLAVPIRGVRNVDVIVQPR
jgi:hypothetical protein